MRHKRIAVIGSGISGLSAAWLLSQRHSVTLFEADKRLGGHAHTATVRCGQRHIPVDTGFIVCNSWTYPNFVALMDYLDQPMTDTDMGFSVSMDGGRFQYSGQSLSTLMGPARQWLDPRHWRMVADLVRFYKTAEDKAALLSDDVTLGQFLVMQGYSTGFARRHILPMAAAIWSASPEQIAQYPVRAFVRFFANHKLFALGDRPAWRTVTGGASSYVAKLAADARFTVRLHCLIRSVLRQGHSVQVTPQHGAAETFDHVVIATHGDQALALLADPSAEEHALLSAFKTSRNDVVLHRDPSHMPRSRRFWSAWNYRASGKAESRLEVTYWMNALQKLDTEQDYFVSLNPQGDIPEALVERRLVYRHPLFSPATLAAQKELWQLQGQNRTWFCGAWFGAGFHEDGLQAGLAVAEQLGGVTRPWRVDEPSGRIHLGQGLGDMAVPLAQAAE